MEKDHRQSAVAGSEFEDLHQSLLEFEQEQSKGGRKSVLYGQARLCSRKSLQITPTRICPS